MHEITSAIREKMKTRFPAPERAGMNRAVAAFEKSCGGYDRWFGTHRDIFSRQREALRSVLPSTGSGLEIGTGTGRFAADLGIRHGLDPSIRMLAMARQRGIETVQGAGEALPYRAGIFDHILMMTVICFMDDIVLPFREAHRVLGPDGILVIGFLVKGGEITRHNKGRHGRFLCHARFRTVEEVTDAAKLAGFWPVQEREDLHGFCIVTARKK